jgi:hypothetical protein
VWRCPLGESALNDVTLFGVDWMQRKKGGLLLADEEAFTNPALDIGINEQFKSEACQVPTRSAVAQTYRNLVDVLNEHGNTIWRRSALLQRWICRVGMPIYPEPIALPFISVTAQVAMAAAMLGLLSFSSS